MTGEILPEAAVEGRFYPRRRYPQWTGVQTENEPLLSVLENQWVDAWVDTVASNGLWVAS